MKNRRILFVLLGTLTAVASGCTVKCDFTRKVEDGGQQGSYYEKCHGRVIICGTGVRNGPGCEDALSIQCKGRKLYRGPYTVDFEHGFLTYTASDWHGSGPAPFIRTELPLVNNPALSELVRDEKRAAGYCDYERRDPTLLIPSLN